MICKWISSRTDNAQEQRPVKGLSSINGLHVTRDGGLNRRVPLVMVTSEEVLQCDGDMSGSRADRTVQLTTRVTLFIYQPIYKKDQSHFFKSNGHFSRPGDDYFIFDQPIERLYGPLSSLIHYISWITRTKESNESSLPEFSTENKTHKPKMNLKWIYWIWRLLNLKKFYQEVAYM